MYKVRRDTEMAMATAGRLRALPHSAPSSHLTPRVLSPQETALLTSGEGGGSELRSPPTQSLMILSKQHTRDRHTSLLLRFTLSHFRVPLHQTSWSGSSLPVLYRPQSLRSKLVPTLQSDLMISIKLKGNQETGSGTSDCSVPWHSSYHHAHYRSM